MRLQHRWWSVLMAAGLVGLVGVTVVTAADEQFLPVLGAREGGQRFIMIPRADGYIAYVTLLNARDGGINGVKLVWEECEIVYDVPRGVECYERLKAMGPTGAAAVHLVSTPLTYALTERATQDQIPLLTAGLGRTDASDGRVFPYVFNPPSTYWSQNTAKIRFIGQRAGGMDQLKGLKIAHVYLDNDYGRETLPILDRQAAQYGFAVQHLAVPAPGLDQKATWLRVKAAQPDWVILRSTGGAMTPTALKEAAQVGVPRDKIVGNRVLCSEQGMVPAGEAAIGFICASFLGTGKHFPLIREMLHYVYARGKRPGIVNDMLVAMEALRRVVTSVPDYEIAWVARDGAEAVEKCAADTPDVILMDLIMPVVDGVEATRRIMVRSPCLILMVTATVGGNASKVFEAMGYGARDAVNTPVLGEDGGVDGGMALLAKIATLGKLLDKNPRQEPHRPAIATARAPARDLPPLVAIGASTGGPAALAHILSKLPTRFAAALVIIQHVDVQFAAGMVDWLQAQTSLAVRLAQDGCRLEIGTVWLAGTNDHMLLTPQHTLSYVAEPRDYPYRPSVDVFFKSLVKNGAAHWPAKAAGVLLTGMGRDGAEGLAVLRRAGWYTISQDQASSVVYGMPKAAAEVGAAMQILSLEAMASSLADLFGESEP